MKELIQSHRVTFIQATIENIEGLARHIKSKQLIINASGTGMGSIFNVPDTIPVRGDLVVATIPLKYIDNYSTKHYAFYTPGMTLHQRYNNDSLEIVFGATTIKGDGSTHFSRENTTRILKHWYFIAHCPHRLEILHNPHSKPEQKESHCSQCDSVATAFANKVIKAMSESSL